VTIDSLTQVERAVFVRMVARAALSAAIRDLEPDAGQLPVLPEKENARINRASSPATQPTDTAEIDVQPSISAPALAAVEGS